MMRRTVTTLAVFLACAAVWAATPASNPFEGPAPAAATTIDKLVFARLDKLGIAPANVCSEGVFVRRVYLDVIGTLPTATEAREFLDSKDPNKRSALIDKLLNRDEFAVYWAMKWCDVLRVKAEFPINLWPNAAQAYHRWIRTSIKENKPYDKFVRELLTASGSNFREPPVNFYRAMQSHDAASIAQTVALTFMGCRADKWPKDRLAAMAAIFSKVGYKSTAEWKEEIVFFDPSKAVSTNPATAPAPAFPDGTPAKLAPDRDPREAFADWLIDAKNPWFAKTAVNRVWCWLLGRGIVHEADDIRPDNPPSNPELLAYLEKELVSAKYDLKHIYRLILNSQVYQLSSVPRSKAPEAVSHFASYPLRQLDAEVLMDALNAITGSTERYSSPIPEPFTYIPENQRAISLADGSITSTFLEMFGRSSRDTGAESERHNRPTAAQRLQLLNSSHVQGKIENSRALRSLAQSKKGVREAATEVYLMILSRFPTDEELKVAEEHERSGKLAAREAMVDLAWALINSTEFLYRH